MERYFIFKSSKQKNKKYDVYNENGNFITSFGDKRYQHYKDKIGLYSHLDHNDEKRRELYYKRFGKTSEPLSAKYFSHKYLW